MAFLNGVIDDDSSEDPLSSLNNKLAPNDDASTIDPCPKYVENMSISSNVVLGSALLIQNKSIFAISSTFTGSLKKMSSNSSYILISCNRSPLFACGAEPIDTLLCVLPIIVVCDGGGIREFPVDCLTIGIGCCMDDDGGSEGFHCGDIPIEAEENGALGFIIGMLFPVEGIGYGFL